MNPESERQPSIGPAKSGEIRKAVVSTIDGRTSPGQFAIRHLGSSDRVKAGLAWLGVFWLVAVVCIALPIIHFVLVPLFLILGPIGFFYGYSSDQRIESGTCTCPACNAPIEFPAGRFKPSYKENCPKCLYALYVQF